jgi:hypothetical protein
MERAEGGYNKRRDPVGMVAGRGTTTIRANLGHLLRAVL